MPTLERSHTISLFRNPVTGLGQSFDPSAPLVHGSTVDIVGTGFGAMPNFAFAGGKSGRIETAPLGADAVTSGGFRLDDGRPKDIVIDAQRGKVWHSEVYDGDIGTADNAVISHDWGSQITHRSKIRIHFANKTNCDAATFQWKQYRGEAGYNYTDGGPETLMFGWRNGGKQCFVRNTTAAVSPQYSAYAPAGAAMNPADSPAWITYDFYEHLSDVDTENGVVSYNSVSNGVAYTLLNNDAVKHFDAGVSTTRQHHILQNLLTNYDAPPTLSDIWIDDFYVQVAPPDTDLVSAYLCNTNDFSTTTLKQIQRPLVGWADTNARIELNIDGVPAGNYYLLIIANKNTKLAELEVTI